MRKKTSMLDVASNYRFIEKWYVIPIPYRKKGPRLDKWQALRLETREQLAEHFDGKPMNIGVLLGACSGDVVDLDIDLPEALPFADGFLPITRTFGRNGNVDSHRLFKSPTAKNRVLFEVAIPGADGNLQKITIVELRANQHQTVFPGSTHEETGESIVWSNSVDLVSIRFDELQRRAGVIAAGAVLSRAWPRTKGSRHACELALAGTLLQSRFTAEGAEKFITLVAAHAATENGSERARKAVKDTADRLTAGKPVTGFTALLTLLSGHSALISKVPQWLGYSPQREGITDHAEPDAAPVSFIEFAPAFLAAVDPKIEFIIPEICPAGVLKLSHGDPRTMKSLAALEEFVAATTGTPAFGLERFTPSRKFSGLYCSQEDPANRVRPRVKGLLRGRGIDTFPENMAFAVYAGIDFDSPEWQERFFEDIVRHGFELVTIDPIRAFTAHADKGPSDILPIAKFLRRLTVRGITAHVIHHDVKPPATGADSRRRSHRASGGGWFSVSECPVSFEKISELHSLVSPEDFKFSADPRPFTMTYAEEDGGRIIRLLGKDSSAEGAAGLVLDGKILTYLAENPGATGSAVVSACRARREDVGAALERLFLADVVDYIQRGRAKLWTLRSAAR